MSTTQTRVKRERPKALRLSDAAAARIAQIIADANGAYAGVRVGVTNGGCAGMAYTMDYADAPQAFEEVVEDKGVKVFIDPKAIMFLIGTEMDFVTREAGVAVRVQQSEPDGGVRLRRIRNAETGKR